MFGKKIKLTDILLILLLVLLALFIVSRYLQQNHSYQDYASAIPALILKGAAKIDDGDSLVIQKQRVRLVGIDAPEFHQNCTDKNNKIYACGILARDYMRDLIKGRHVECFWIAKDKYHRILGHCFAGETDLNRAMVVNGWAVYYGYDNQSNNNYKREEHEARTEKRGLWQGHFQQPKNWRKEHPHS